MSATNPGSGSSLARSSLVMATGTLVSRLLGVARVALLVAALGAATPAANVWETANTIPNTIYLLLAAGVLNVVLLPQIVRAMTRGEQGQDYTDRLITLAVTMVAAGTVLMLLAAPLVTKLNALSWGWDDPKLQLAVLFAYLCIPQVLFYGLHTLLGQILAAHHRFAAFMWSPALANVVAISGILVFLSRYGDVSRTDLAAWTPGMIWLLAGSATLGIVVQALVLLPAVRATGFRWRFRWGFRGVGLGSASVMAGWALADVAVSQGGMLVVTNLLNNVANVVDTAPGKAAHLYAFLSFMLPHSLIALSLLTAVYPLLSRAAAEHDLAAMADHAARGLRMLGAAMVPIALGMMVLAPLVVRVLNPTMTEVEQQWVTRILLAFTVGLVPYGVYLLCGRVFYSFEDARTPFTFQVTITAVLVVVCLLSLLAPVWWVAVLLALGQALGQLAAAALGLAMVRRRLPMIDLRGTGATYLRAGAAAAVALLPLWVLVRVLDRPGFLGAVLTLGVSGAVYLLVYAVLAHLWGVAEVAEVLGPVLRRVPGGSRVLARERTGADRVLPYPEDWAGPEGADRGPEATPEPADDPSSRAPRPPSGTRTGTLGLDDAPSGGGGEDGSMDRLEVGTHLAHRYALDELLAERDGGDLQYWSARDATLGRLVAVTVLPSTGEHEVVAEAVLDGARRVASVDDPRLVRVLDVGEQDGLCWIIEEGLSEAESLASLVAEQPLPAEEVRRIVGEAAAGLESARRRGLHHLYLNPHSVLRTTDGTVKISGVGVASALEGTDDVTADEASLIDTADLVSLIYTGLTGRWPGEDLPGVRPARRLADGSLPAPSELVAQVPGDLDALCRLVHGPEADLGQAPYTPGELARQLSPWSSEMVRGPRPEDLSAPGAPVDAQTRTAGALGGSAGAVAAAAAAHPRSAEGPDATEVVPSTYFRTEGRDRTTTSGTGDPSEQHRTNGTVQGRGEPATGAAAATGGPGDDQYSEVEDGLEDEQGTWVQTAVVGLVIVGLIGVALVLAWGALGGIGADDDTQAGSGPAQTAPVDPTQAPDGEDEATAAPPEDDPAAAPPPAAAPDGEGIAVLGITSFDPEGDGDERNDLTPLALDGDPETAWTSHTYLSSNWGGLKSGTGLILDLGEGATVAEVDVDLGEGDVGATLFLADAPSLDGAQQLGSDEAASGTWTVSAEEGATGRYLIVWFTRAFTAPEGEIVSVREISVR